jgi:hypothetical protein
VLDPNGVGDPGHARPSTDSINADLDTLVSERIEYNVKANKGEDGLILVDYAELRDDLVKHLQAYADKQAQAREVAARLDEAKYWEYNIIPAVRSAQVEKDVQKRLATLTHQEKIHES